MTDAERALLIAVAEALVWRGAIDRGVLLQVLIETELRENAGDLDADARALMLLAATE